MTCRSRTVLAVSVYLPKRRATRQRSPRLVLIALIRCIVDDLSFLKIVFGLDSRHLPELAHDLGDAFRPPPPELTTAAIARSISRSAYRQTVHTGVIKSLPEAVHSTADGRKRPRLR